MNTKILKVVSNVGNFAADNSMSTMCWYIFHQPVVPKALLDKKK